MITNFNKKRQINFFSRVRITSYLQLFDLDRAGGSFWLSPESYVFFKSVKTDWAVRMRRFLLNEAGLARSDFVGGLSSFNYLNFDVRSLLVKYRCFFKKNGIVTHALYVIVSKAVWVFLLSFVLVVWFFLLFCAYVWLVDVEVFANIWDWCEKWTFFLYLDGLFSWVLFLILKLLAASNCVDFIHFDFGTFWSVFVHQCLSYLNFLFIGWETSMSSFEFFVSIPDQIIWNKIWVGLIFAVITLVAVLILLFAFFYGFWRTDLWGLALKLFYGDDRTRGVLAVDTLNPVSRLVFANKVSLNLFRLNSSNYQELYFDFLQNQTFGGFAGFVDLFPAYDSVFNYSNFLSKRFRRQSFNRELAGTITQYWSLSTYARNYLRRRTSSLSFLLLKSTVGSIAPPQLWQSFNKTSFIDDRFYLIPRLQLATNFFSGFNVLKFFRNVSVGGEFNVQELRRRLFLALTRKKDPWFFSASVPNLHEFKVSTSKDLVNWYARELNSVVLSRTLRGKVSFFNNYSMSRFRFGWQNLVNDYSFWRTPTNEHNTFEHSDVFFTTPEEEDYSGESHWVRAGDVLNEGEIEEEDPEEYVDETSEMFFEDGLLHKSLDSLLFDDEVDEALGDVGVSDLEIDVFDEEEFVDFLNNQGVIYKAGPERDYTVTTSSRDYSGTYGLEYDQPKAYLEQVFSSFYDELVDLYWVGGFKTFYLNLLEYPNSRVLGVWPTSKAFNLKRAAKRIRVGRLFKFYGQQSKSLFIPPYGRLVTNFLVTNFFFICMCLIIGFCCIGLWFGVSMDLFIEGCLTFVLLGVGLLFFLNIIGFSVALQFFYGPCLSFFFLAEMFLFVFGCLLGIFLSDRGTLEIFKRLRSHRSGDTGLINFDIFILKLAGGYGFFSLPTHFFFRSLSSNKLTLALGGSLMLCRNLLVVFIESYFIDVTRGLRKFGLLWGVSSGFPSSNNSIQNNYSFLFTNSFELGVRERYRNLGGGGNLSGVTLAALDFYYVENNFFHLRKRILPAGVGALGLGEVGISDGVVFRSVDRMVGKLRFTLQGPQIAGFDQDFLENFKRSSNRSENSFWSSGSRVDSYSGAFMFFSSLEWTKALWHAEYELNLESFKGFAGASLYENTVTEHSLLNESFEKAGFPATQKFKFLGINLPGIAERFHKTEGREFVRLFLANKVISTNYTIRNASEASSLFETLFYSSFFDMRAADKFYTKRGL